VSIIYSSSFFVIPGQRPIQKVLFIISSVFWSLFISFSVNSFEFLSNNGYVDSSTTIEAGKWYFVTAVYNLTHTLIYVNGNLENSSVTNGTK